MAEKKAKTMALGKGLGDKGINGMDLLIPNKNASKKKSTTTAKENNVSRETLSDEKESQTNSEVLINISLIEPNKSQPRKEFNEESLIELSESIKQVGIIQPIILQKREKTYEIIAGERRWRAAKLAGLKEIPAIIKDYTDKEIVEISIIENIQREDLNPIEEAFAYKRLMEEFNLTQDEVSERVGKSRSAIANSTRLLKLGENIRQMLIDGQLSSGHARALIPIEDDKMQYKIALKITDEKLSVRETEKLVNQILHEKEEKEEKKNKSEPDVNIEAIYRDMEEKITNCLGTKVKIKNKDNNAGKIEIEYYSTEELERLYEIFNR